MFQLSTCVAVPCENSKIYQCFRKSKSCCKANAFWSSCFLKWIAFDKYYAAAKLLLRLTSLYSSSSSWTGMSGADLSKAYQALALVPDKKCIPCQSCDVKISPSESQCRFGRFVHAARLNQPECQPGGRCHRSRPPEIEPLTETG